MTLYLAVTTLEKLKDVPKQFWYNAGMILGCLILLIIIVRYMRQMNKIYLTILIGMIVSLIGFNWIYERNEPAILTPAVDVIAQFFPTKGMYGSTQSKDTLKEDNSKKKR